MSCGETLLLLKTKAAVLFIINTIMQGKKVPSKTC